MEKLLETTERLFKAQRDIEKMCKICNRDEFWDGATWAITFIRMRLVDLNNQKEK